MKKKVLLLHGWDWRKYPKFAPVHQWQNRQEFLNLMKREFDVDYPSLPGFAVQHGLRHVWRLLDYAEWLRERIKLHKYDALVGYSFGAAIILKYLAESNDTGIGSAQDCVQQLPTVLVSPAISRKYKPKKSGFKAWLVRSAMNIARKTLTTVLGTKITSWLRHIYMMVWVRNKFYVHATPFLRGTYMNIVDENLSDDLRSVLKKNNNIHLVFGGEDSITPSSLLFSQVPEAKFVTTFIENGGHHIGTSHPQQLFESIRMSLENTTQ